MLSHELKLILGEDKMIAHFESKEIAESFGKFLLRKAKKRSKNFKYSIMEIQSKTVVAKFVWDPGK